MVSQTGRIASLARSPRSSYVGVDGCRAGWLVAAVSDAGEWAVRCESTFRTVWQQWRRARLILVDIPIGLRHNTREERACDLETRRIVGKPRCSSVFPAPSRPAVYARSYAQACRIHFRVSKRQLSRQSWNIASKIRQVDEVLQRDLRAREKIVEVHPELLFWAFNRGRSMAHSKRTREGFCERLNTLNHYWPKSANLVQFALEQFRRSEVSPDDVLDALVAALTGLLARGSLRSVPDLPEWDSTGLPMRMVYWPANSFPEVGFEQSVGD